MSSKHPKITHCMVLIILTTIVLLVPACRECFAQTPTPVPTPADGSSGEDYYNYILTQYDAESWVESNYDPVTTRRGVCIRVKNMIFQSARADIAVRCTYGYENIYYEGTSGDIRGLNLQGFVDIEGAEVVFGLMDLFVSSVWAKSDKWKKVKAIKKLSKLQTKPNKPKKEKWKTSNGLKEKKHALEVSP